MSTTSAISIAISALVDLLAADPALAAVDVVDGPLLDWSAMRPAAPQRGDGRLWVVVGAQPDEDARAAEGEQTWGSTGSGTNHSRDETFAVYCTAVGFDGGQDVRALRTAVFGLVARVETILRADPTIGGTVLYSLFGGVTRLDQAATPKGITVDALFNVQCRAYLTP